MLHFNASKQTPNSHTPNVQVQFSMLLHCIPLSPRSELRGLHNPNQEKLLVKLSFLLSFFKSGFLCIFVLLLKLLSYIRHHNILPFFLISNLWLSFKLFPLVDNFLQCFNYARFFQLLLLQAPFLDVFVCLKVASIIVLDLHVLTLYPWVETFNFCNTNNMVIYPISLELDGLVYCSNFCLVIKWKTSSTTVQRMVTRSCSSM